MTRNVSQYRSRDRFNLLKMAKTKSVMLLLMIITACALIFSLSDAYPTPEEEMDAQVQSAEGGKSLESGEESNSSESSTSWSFDGSTPKNPKLVITHVVKTLEFEVDEVDSDENSTETTENVTNYEETDIKLLDVNLLRDLVNNTPTNESGKRKKKSAEEEKESGEESENTTKSKGKSSTEKGGGDADES